MRSIDDSRNIGKNIGKSIGNTFKKKVFMEVLTILFL